MNSKGGSPTLPSPSISPESPSRTQSKKRKKSVKKTLKGFNFDNKKPGKLNPYRKIKIGPIEYHSYVEDAVLDFVEQLCLGYLWDVRYNQGWIARHDETGKVVRILEGIITYKKMRKTGKDMDTLYGERFPAWTLVELATVIREMWD